MADKEPRLGFGTAAVHAGEPRKKEGNALTTPIMQTNSGDTCRAMALDDQGVILQPGFLVAPDVAAGTLVELMPEFRVKTLGTGSRLGLDALGFGPCLRIDALCLGPRASLDQLRLT